ncbi:hypothetical protein SDC9_137030 [bioreactor metagenome]|uniref:Uncharacterized protein n=1 Tax=bioreactor metagenome TaxID=1076179 RepID=A0A645DKW3_9ZZZZ
MPTEFQPHGLPVQVPVKIQQIGLHGDIRPVVDGGPGPHIGDAAQLPAVRQAGPCGVNPVAGYQHMGRNGKVDGGDTDGPPDTPPVLHDLRQHMGMAQKFRRPRHLTQFHQPADIGRADGDPRVLHLRNNVAADSKFCALAPQKLRRALVFISEMMVVPRHQMNGVVSLRQNFRHKRIPRGGHHLVVKRYH